MKKILWLSIALLVGGYSVNSYLEKDAKRKTDLVEKKRIEQEIKASVQEVVSRTNAVNDWESKLSNGKRYRIEPILTVELEKLWLIERPILFAGSIHDIKTLDDTYYIVIVERSLLSSMGNMYRTNLQLSLVAPKKQIDIFLKNYPDWNKGIGFNNGFAVIAKINSIETIYISGAKEGREEIKIGHGNMIDVEYLGRVRL